MCGVEGQETAVCAQHCVMTGNSSVCTALRNGEIYSLNDNVIIILFSTDIAYRMFKVIINKLIGFSYSDRTAQ